MSCLSREGAACMLKSGLTGMSRLLLTVDNIPLRLLVLLSVLGPW